MIDFKTGITESGALFRDAWFIRKRGICVSCRQFWLRRKGVTERLLHQSGRMAFTAITTRSTELTQFDLLY